MAFSTLSLPAHPKGTHGLWDDSSNKYLHIGTEDECDTMKESLERQEQLAANNLWRDQVYEKRLAFLIKSGLPETNARGIVDRMFRMA